MCFSSFIQKFKFKNKSNNNCVKSESFSSNKKFEHNLHNTKSINASNQNVISFKRLFCCKKRRCSVSEVPELELVQKQPILNKQTPELSNNVCQNHDGDHLHANDHELNTVEDTLIELKEIVNCRHADLLQKIKIIPYKQFNNNKVLLQNKENLTELLQNFARKTKLGHFSEKLVITSGVRSSVYYAKDNRLSGKSIALKQISLNIQKDYQSIINEISFLLNKQILHDNILAATECFLVRTFEKQELFIAMEYCNGGCLRQLLTTNLTENQIAYIVKEVLCGLAFLHSNVNIKIFFKFWLIT